MFAHPDNGESGSATHLFESEIVKENGWSFRIRNMNLNPYNTLQGHEVLCMNESGATVAVELHSYLWLSDPHEEEDFHDHPTIAAGHTYT